MRHALGVMLLFLVGSAQAGTVLDQNQNTGLLDQPLAYFTVYDLVQSFQQSNDNIIGAGIMLHLDWGGGGDVEIYVSDSLSGGNVLGWGIGSGVAGEWVDVFWDEAAVVPGTTLYLRLVSDQLYSLAVSGAINNPYPDGIAYAWNGDPVAGGLIGFPEFDFTFRTYASVDTIPATVEVIGAPLHLHHQGQGGLPDDSVSVVVIGTNLLLGDTADLDASIIDPVSLRFGPSQALVDPASTPDLNYNHDNDGTPDAKFEFKMSDTGFAFTPGADSPCSASPAELSGELSNGELFSGVDAVVSTNCNAQCH